MLAAVENRFGNKLHTPSEIEWLSDNGSGYTADDNLPVRSGHRPEAIGHAGVQPEK
jgi:transposase InsO family protein